MSSLWHHTAFGIYVEFVQLILWLFTGFVVSYFPSQIEACNKEAEKIESLINSDSPTLVSHVPLSALIISQVQVSISLPSATIQARPPCHSLLLLLSLGLAFCVLWLITEGSPGVHSIPRPNFSILWKTFRTAGWRLNSGLVKAHVTSSPHSIFFNLPTEVEFLSCFCKC